MRKELKNDGISFEGYALEAELIQSLRQASFAVIPTAISEEVEDRPEISKFSLPSRLIYIIATANTPILVVGRKDSGAAQFVTRHHVGVVCDYDLNSFRKAVEHLRSRPVQDSIRQRASRLAGCFSADKMAEWIWRSLEKGKPSDLRFETLGRDVDAIITLNEVNQRHGTGALVKRIFPDNSSIISIRSNNHYDGDHQFGEFSMCLSKVKSSRKDVSQSLSDHLKGATVKRIFCVPYNKGELVSALSLKLQFDVPMATYIMDDQNICVDNVPDNLMREFLSKCSLRLGTHKDLCQAYEEKYGFKFWILPAIVPDPLIQLSPQSPDAKLSGTKTGALVGSIWSKRWFNLISKTVQGANIPLDWFGNTQYPWLKSSGEAIQKRGLTPHGILDETELVERIKDYPYVVVPTGTLGTKDDRPELSRLSLPGRILFTLATSNTPILLLGSKESSAGHFVKHFKIGTICDYHPQNYKKAVDYITTPEVQAEFRRNAVEIAKCFSAKGVTDWVWRSVEKGEAADKRFEELMSY